ncbi:MAG: hypothetical protein ACLP8B_24525, partial [Xanthobacteraceae bacterium]
MRLSVLIQEWYRSCQNMYWTLSFESANVDANRSGGSGHEGGNRSRRGDTGCPWHQSLSCGPGRRGAVRHYLPKPLFAHLDPTFDRLGALAGGRLDELAGTADRNPPVLSVRRRPGEDCHLNEKHPANVEIERLAVSELGLEAVS